MPVSSRKPSISFNKAEVKSVMAAPHISSIADVSSILYQGRAESPDISDNVGMGNETWRDRLTAALIEQKKSMRQVSLDAGLGPGYVHSILKGGKDPTIDLLLKVCEAAEVSLPWVISGVNVTPEVEALLAELSAADPVQRRAMLTLLRSKAPA